MSDKETLNTNVELNKLAHDIALKAYNQFTMPGSSNIERNIEDFEINIKSIIESTYLKITMPVYDENRELKKKVEQLDDIKHDVQLVSSGLTLLGFKVENIKLSFKPIEETINGPKTEVRTERTKAD